MPLNPASTTDQAAKIAKAAEEAAANSRFLDLLAPLVDTAAANGDMQVVVHTFVPMDLQAVATTLRDLGYKVSFIDSLRLNFNPSELFGELWDNYWYNGGYIPRDVKNPTRIKIGWENT